MGVSVACARTSITQANAVEPSPPPAGTAVTESSYTMLVVSMLAGMVIPVLSPA